MSNFPTFSYQIVSYRQSLVCLYTCTYVHTCNVTECTDAHNQSHTSQHIHLNLIFSNEMFNLKINVLWGGSQPSLFVQYIFGNGAKSSLYGMVEVYEDFIIRTQIICHQLQVEVEVLQEEAEKGVLERPEKYLSSSHELRKVNNYLLTSIKLLMNSVGLCSSVLQSLEGIKMCIHNFAWV